MGRYVERVHSGVLGPEPYRALVPHRIAGWRRATATCGSARWSAHPRILWCDDIGDYWQVMFMMDRVLPSTIRTPTRLAQYSGMRIST